MATSTATNRTASPEAEPDLVVDAARNAASDRLMDSLLHDVRNPLNALSINLDVLTEKLRREQGELPPSQEKNLKTMRDQVFRVDALLKAFAAFMAPRRPEGDPPADLSGLVNEVLAVLAYECRRAMLKVRTLVEPEVQVAGADGALLRFVALQLVYRGVLRAGTEGELDVSLQREDGAALLRVRDCGPASQEPLPHALEALAVVAARLGADLRIGTNECVIRVPLA